METRTANTQVLHVARVHRRRFRRLLQAQQRLRAANANPFTIVVLTRRRKQTLRVVSAKLACYDRSFPLLAQRQLTQCPLKQRLPGVAQAPPTTTAPSMLTLAPEHGPLADHSPHPQTPSAPRMARQYDEDLFKDSTMTFGEHLEELRGALFRAVIGLTLAVGVGLYFGDSVVGLIQYPLKKALVKYYQQNSADKALAAGLITDGDQFKQELQANNQVSIVVEEAPRTGNNNTVKANPGNLAREQMLRFLLEQQVDKRGLYTPESFPELPEDLQATAKNYKELTPEEMTAFHQALLKRTFSPPANADGTSVRQSHLQYFNVEDYEPLKVKSMSTTEPFMIYLKASFLFGLVVSSPWIFYQLWMFVGAGLYPHEKKYVTSFLPMSLLLFLLGASTAFFLVFAPVLEYLLSFNKWLGIDPEPRINEWLGFAIMLPLAFGISFQLPLVMLFLERIGIFTVNTYLAKWRISVLVIAIMSAVLSPGGDPWSMLIMTTSLVVLFFGGVALCKIWPKPSPAS
jgi:sec-independent protein translocase protein TatC